MWSFRMSYINWFYVNNIEVFKYFWLLLYCFWSSNQFFLALIASGNFYINLVGSNKNFFILMLHWTITVFSRMSNLSIIAFLYKAFDCHVFLALTILRVYIVIYYKNKKKHKEQKRPLYGWITSIKIDIISSL